MEQLNIFQLKIKCYREEKIKKCMYFDVRINVFINLYIYTRKFKLIYVCN